MGRASWHDWVAMAIVFPMMGAVAWGRFAVAREKDRAYREQKRRERAADEEPRQ